MGLQLAGLHPQLRPAAEAAVAWAARYGVQPTITSVWRSWEEQAKLYAEFQRGGRKYPANAPGDSAHQFGLAWDSWVPDAYMPWWVAVRRAYGWQVPNNDVVHAELANWRRYVVPLKFSS
jgi:hypothetical protein